jgi:hypothetical protein
MNVHTPLSGNIGKINFSAEAISERRKLKMIKKYLIIVIAN